MLDLALAFTAGLLVSVHCVAMCGGFVAAYSLRIAGARRPGDSLAAVLRPGLLWAHFLYNAGRLTTYALLGGVMGLVGSFIGASGRLMGVQGLASILAGAFMILLGLSLGRWLPYTPLLQPAWAAKFGALSRAAKGFAARASSLGVYPLGLLLGLMPCGPLYAMEINAAGTGSVSRGMLTLLAFGLGTVPMLYGFGMISSVLGASLPRGLFRVASVIIVLLGFLTLMRGLAMNGLVPHVGLW